MAPSGIEQIVHEHHSQTTKAALICKPCPFCNRNERVDNLKIWDISDLDITLLEIAMNILHVHYNQQRIQSHSIYDGRYHACSTCAKCVKGRNFFKIPLYSWANGCWIGTIPPELSSLSYTEELVITRAQTTKCWVKINAGFSPPFFISSLHLGTRHILCALNWLKENNPLYHDIEINLIALTEYPADDDGCVPFPVQHQSDSHGIDTTEAIFAEHSGSDENIPLLVTGTFDIETSGIDLDSRKVEALWRLKAGVSFAKTSTMANTLSVRDNPNVYGMLWPVLFPYGVGMFDGPVRLQKELGFKPIMLKSPVQHYLQMADCRFQTHFAFPFAMHNIQTVRKLSHQLCLAVCRAWWPKAMAAMVKIDDDTLASLTTTMAAKKARKDYSKYTPATPTESTIFELLQYANYISDHIESLASEILKMREEIQAITALCGTTGSFDSHCKSTANGMPDTCSTQNTAPIGLIFGYAIISDVTLANCLDIDFAKVCARSQLLCM
ncbi:hypothetical protein DFH08DRAFT_799399 [Mycena albidolilacea]|uniref:DUF6570 domain-containing protein n=1 Tax=Mycena albidolilacea TaxID=1033008 RepID=A0AAD7F0W5_9AGAR|nr:hypothetical protein DFH08DRAFT_799399 [Mycena albidolilacea]